MTNKEAAKASHGRLFTTKQEHPSPQRRQRGHTAELILLSLAAYSTRHTRHASTDARIKQPTSGSFCPVTVRSVNYCPQRHFHLTTASSEFDPFSPAESVKSHRYITIPLQHSSHTMRCVTDKFRLFYMLFYSNLWEQLTETWTVPSSLSTACCPLRVIYWWVCSVLFCADGLYQFIRCVFVLFLGFNIWTETTDKKIGQKGKN